MRITLDVNQSVHFGQKLTVVLKKLVPATGEVSLTQCQETFHKLNFEDQANRFSNPLWEDIVKSHLPLQTYEPKTNGALVSSLAITPDFKSGVDVTIQVNDKDGELAIEAINLEKGGVGATTAEAMVKLIDSGRDAYIHPCILTNTDKKEFWLVQSREAFPNHVIEESTEILKQELEKNSSETLVLSAIHPSGANDNYFAQISLIAHRNSKPVIFNPRQGHVKEISVDLFKKGRVDIVKPNVIEFVQLLQHTGILYGDEKVKVDELKKEAKEHKFLQTIGMAKTLMDKYKFHIRTMFITFGEDGLLIVTRKNVVYVPTPKIKLECSSGAGDSGIAGMLVKAKENNIDLRRGTLHSSELIELGKAFNYAAAATASLPGTNIANKDQINDLKSREEIKAIVKK